MITLNHPALLKVKETEILFKSDLIFIDASNYGLTLTNSVDVEELTELHYNNQSLEILHKTAKWYPAYTSSYSALLGSPFVCSGTSPVQSSIDLIVSGSVAEWLGRQA